MHILRFQQITFVFCDISGFSPLKMMILLSNKQNSLILLGFFSFSRMEIPVYNLGECTPWVNYLTGFEHLVYTLFQTQHDRKLFMQGALVTSSAIKGLLLNRIYT